MSGRSSGYQLRDTNVARTPLRYRDYGIEQESEPTRRAVRRSRQQQSEAVLIPKIETVTNPSLSQSYHSSSATRIYANTGMEPELEYEGIDSSSGLINDDLTMLNRKPGLFVSTVRSKQPTTTIRISTQFVFCEFFYSAVDKQLFLEENEFSQLVQDSFPNLKTTKLRLPEWRTVRRLIGKPRRLSQVFLREELRSLETKRRLIREIYNGTRLTLPPDYDLPKKLPRQLSVGMKVYARIREPKDGIYAGTIDAVTEDGYRVMFEKEEMISARPVADSEIMCEAPLELYSISYFIEMNNASNKSGIITNTMFPKPTFVVDPRRAQVVSMSNAPNQPPTFAFQSRSVALKDEKIGNFPLRMLVIMVKLFKVLEHKKVLLQNLTWLNDEGERMHLLTRSYPVVFQERYAEILRELESINRLLESYMNGIEEYNDLLVQSLAEPRPMDRPEQLRKSTIANANQLVKHCNASLQVKSKEALSLISKLNSHYASNSKAGRGTILAESLNQIKYDLAPSNVSYFQDCVEVHMRQIFLMMKNKTL
ncbi:DIRP domain-containing protein [Aphelenchoides bicaudatus]|nr:DIRP domain-containing protein [Aphelenchoides bicaudatus]